MPTCLQADYLHETTSDEGLLIQPLRLHSVLPPHPDEVLPLPSQKNPGAISQRERELNLRTVLGVTNTANQERSSELFADVAQSIIYLLAKSLDTSRTESHYSSSSFMVIETSNSSSLSSSAS